MNSNEVISIFFILLASIVIIVSLVFDVWGYVVIAVVTTIILMIIIHVIQDHNSDAALDFEIEQTLRESRKKTEQKEREEEVLRDRVEQEFDRLSEFEDAENFR